MEIQTLLILFASGCLAGFLAGFFGVGGGVILVPIFLFVFGHFLGISGFVLTHLSLGTSLLVVVFASLSSAYQHYRNGNVIPSAVAVIGASSVLAAFGGTYLASVLSGSVLQQIFAVVVALTAATLLTEGAREPRRKGEPRLNKEMMVLTGAGSGFIAAVAGVGGGIFAVPMMHYFLRFPMKKAVGTSSAVIVLTATAGVIGYMINGAGNQDLLPYAGFTVGYVDYLHAIPVIAGTLPTARLGANIVRRTRGRSLRFIFGVFLLIISVRMFFL